MDGGKWVWEGRGDNRERQLKLNPIYGVVWKLNAVEDS